MAAFAVGDRVVYQNEQAGSREGVVVGWRWWWWWWYVVVIFIVLNVLVLWT